MRLSMVLAFTWQSFADRHSFRHWQNQPRDVSTHYDRERATKAASATDRGRLGLSFNADLSRDVRIDVIFD